MSNRIYVGVVDDDESLSRSLARLLRQAGYQAITYSSAEEFLADPLRAHFACLLVDVQLGGMTGIDMHGKLAAEGIRTPVVYITAFDNPVAREQAARLGCAGYFRKTDAGLDILETVRRVTSDPGVAAS